MIGTTLWRPLITTVAAEYPPLDPVVFEAMVLVESNGDPNARSASNAVGLTQIIARWHLPTIERIAAERGFSGTPDSALLDPEINLRVGASHLRWCFTSDGSRSMERAVRKYFTGTADPPPGFVDGQGTSPDQHITKLRAALVTVRADMADSEPTKEEPMAYKAHQWPGLKNPVYLPDWIPVEVKIITNGRFRSDVNSSSHVRTTWHDTGNPGTNARGEYTWANNGRQGAGIGGYNGIFDDKVVIITQPFDEVIWAAGTPTGNATSYHFEQAWGTGVNFEKSLEVGAAVHGGLMAAKGWTTAGSLVQHNYWYGKDCPGQIRRKGLWPRVVAMVEAARIAALNAAGGTRPDPAGPVYAQPIQVKELEYDTFPPALVTHEGSDFVYVGDLVEAVRETPRLQKAFAGAEKTGANIKAGEQFPVEWLFKADDGQWYYLSPWATRIRYADTKRIADSDADIAA